MRCFLLSHRALPHLRLPRFAVAAAVVSVFAMTGCAGTSTGSAPAGASGPGSVPSSAAAASAVPTVAGLVVYASTFDAATTVSKVQEKLAAGGMVTATVDHAAAAASIGQKLRPTTVVIGGNPRAGTPLIAAAQTSAIDLPQKHLVWQAADGTVYLGYNAAEYIAARAGLDPTNPVLGGLRTGSAAVAAAATGTDHPVADGSATAAGPGTYLVAKTSDTTVAGAIDRYTAAFVAKALKPVATVDHAAGAASIGATLRPTETTFVGNPMVGTALLQSQQTMGIDLPVRYLAWQDQAGTVHVAHPDIRILAARHHITGLDNVLTMIDKATVTFTATAAGTGN